MQVSSFTCIGCDDTNAVGVLRLTLFSFRSYYQASPKFYLLPVELTTYMDPSTSSRYRVDPAIADKTDEDLSHEEFKNTYLRLNTDTRRGDDERSMKGAVCYVKNQGSCIAAVEAINKIVTGNLTKLLSRTEVFARKRIILIPWKKELARRKDVHINDEKCLLKALAHQPLRVAIDASAREFQFYSGDVFDGRCGVDLDHGVAAVGVKRNSGKPEGLNQ
ncbi:hypothetical protein Bca101_035649 [Brassica carinata]